MENVAERGEGRVEETTVIVQGEVMVQSQTLAEREKWNHSLYVWGQKQQDRRADGLNKGVREEGLSDGD